MLRRATSGPANWPMKWRTIFPEAGYIDGQSLIVFRNGTTVRNNGGCLRVEGGLSDVVSFGKRQCCHDVGISVRIGLAVEGICG